MGYWTNPSQVEDNKATLELILQAMANGEPLEIEVKDINRLNNEHFHLRQILKAADTYPNAAGGRYFGIGKQVRVIPEVHETGRAVLRVQFKTSGKLAVREVSPIAMQVAQLDHFLGQTTILKFNAKIEINEAELIRAVEAKGFTLNPDHKSADDKEIWYVVNRKPREKAGSDIMRELGFTRDRR